MVCWTGIVVFEPDNHGNQDLFDYSALSVGLPCSSAQMFVGIIFDNGY